MFTRPFLAVQTSFWPLLVSLRLFSVTSNIVIWFRYKVSFLNVVVAITITTVIAFLWWKDFSRERMIGYHTHKLEFRLRIGMLLFILSEVCFFFSFFWAFFHSALAPTIEIGSQWPGVGIIPLDAWSVPFLNTVILLTSGATLTWSHHAIISGDRYNTIISLFLTLVLGVIFTGLQYMEYLEAPFTIADSVYGSTFFVATGFHGLHVLIGTTFLIVCFFRILKHHFTKHHHNGYEAAIFYWHFVDYVWIFLFISIYWWGS